jgi:hypothetical protein
VRQGVAQDFTRSRLCALRAPAGKTNGGGEEEEEEEEEKKKKKR